MITRRGFFGLLAGAVTAAAARVVAPIGQVVSVRKPVRYAVDKDLGVSVRFVRQYDLQSDRLTNRYDVLYGCDLKVLDAQRARNFDESQAMELMQLQPKAPYFAMPGDCDDHVKQWNHKEIPVVPVLTRQSDFFEVWDRAHERLRLPNGETVDVVRDVRA